MKCEDLQFYLPVYADNILNDDERAAVEAHLSQCPLCRQKNADFQELRNGLRAFARPEMSAQTLNSLRGAVAAELQINSPRAKNVFSNDFKEWLKMRVMPYGVGALASLILGFTLLWSLLSAARIEKSENSPQYDSFSNTTVLLADANSKKDSGASADLTASEYARSRFAISAESPSVNPQGALIALTKSLMSDDMLDKEVVVVADVYGSGLAEIAEVVEPSRNRHAVYELEKALKTDADDAPFVRADLDRRSDSVRVVFRIQSVNVKTNLKPLRQ